MILYTNNLNINRGALVEVTTNNSVTKPSLVVEPTNNNSYSLTTYQFQTIGEEIHLLQQQNQRYQNNTQTQGKYTTQINGISIYNILNYPTYNYDGRANPHLGIFTMYTVDPQEMKAESITIPFITSSGFEYLRENTTEFYWECWQTAQGTPTVTDINYSNLTIYNYPSNYQYHNQYTPYGNQLTTVYNLPTTKANTAYYWGTAENIWQNPTPTLGEKQITVSPLGIIYEGQDDVQYEYEQDEEVYTSQLEFAFYTSGWINATNNYAQGYKNGKDDGFEEGLEIGREQGYNEGLSEAENSTFAGPFTLLGQAFNSTAGILQTEIFPHFTIGMILFIPIAVSIAVAIFKAIKR